MSESGIGRVLVASLHQAIADLLPGRLEFYENWLNPEGLRNGRIGLAPLAAVLSFLRQEDAGGSYELVVTRAGEYAAEWTAASRPVLKRALSRRLPASWRVRAALKLARRIVHDSYKDSRATARVRGRAGRLVIRGSVFCQSGRRQKTSQPLCGYYLAATKRCLDTLNVRADAHIGGCFAAGGSGCHLVVVVHPANRRGRPSAGQAARSGDS